MYFSKTKTRPRRFSSFVRSQDERRDDEAAEPLLPAVDKHGDNRTILTAGKRSLYDRKRISEGNLSMSEVANTTRRGFLLTRRSWNCGRQKERSEHMLLRNERSEDRKTIEEKGLLVHEDSVHQGFSRVNRRMAICEELEKSTLFQGSTLQELRLNLVVRSRLYEYGLLA